MAVNNIRKDKEIPVEQLKKAFNILGGTLYWAVKTRRTNVGQIAGYPNIAGYYDVCYKGKRYYAHRIVFAIQNGRWPVGVVDHIDGNPANNSPENLREASDSQSCFNHKRRKDNSTGVIGVSRHSGGFHAEISAYNVRHRKWFKKLKSAKNWIQVKRQELHEGRTRYGEVK